MHEKQQILRCDERSRICLTQEVVGRYGKNFVMVKAPDEIILIPVPEDPLKSLQKEGKKMPKGMSIKELKKEIIKQALKDIK